MVYTIKHKEIFMKKYSLTHWIAVTALLMALVIASGYIPRVATPVGNVYWCDGLIILSAVLVDPLSAFMAGGVSMLLYDLIAGSAYMAPVSLVIHGLQVAVVSAIIHYLPPRSEKASAVVVKAIVAAVASVAIVVSGYFLYRSFIAGGEKSGVAYALSKMPANFIQEGVGIAVAYIIAYAMRLKNLLMKNGLLPRPLHEILKKKKSADGGSAGKTSEEGRS